MDILRKIVWFCLFCSLGLVISTWENDYAKTRITHSDSEVSIVKSEPSVASLTQTVPNAHRVSFTTDTLQGIIDTRGGHLVKLELLKYPQYIGKGAPPTVLLDRSDSRYYTAQTDVATMKNGHLIKQDHIYRSAHRDYILAPDQKELKISLYTKPQGVSIVKEFVLKLNSYQIDVNYQVKNNTPVLWKGQIYAELNKFQFSESSGWLNIASYSGGYSGGAVSTDKKSYQKIKFDQIAHQKLPPEDQVRWLALIEPHFTSAWISKLPSSSYYASQNNNIYTLGLSSDPWRVEAGKIASRKLSLYVGPKIIDQLAASAKHLDLIVDYGIFWWLATGLFRILKYIHQVIDNWGWAIVLLTTIIQLVFYRMTASSFRTMLTRYKLRPQLTALKERYGNDLHRLMQAESELYRREGFKPRAGFLSGLVTTPISFTLYWLLLENVELRHEPFVLWIRDLSAQDPYYILPLLFGLSTFVNNSLTPAQSNDPTQERIALLLPALLTWLFLNVPAGLTLYWVMNNLLSILQKLWILRELPFEQIISYRKK